MRGDNRESAALSLLRGSVAQERDPPAVPAAEEREAQGATLVEPFYQPSETSYGFGKGEF